MKRSTEPVDTEDRLHLNSPLFRQPGTSQPRRYEAKVRARVAELPGRSARAERRATEMAAEAKAPAKPKTLAELLGKLEGMASSGELQRRRAEGHARRVENRLQRGGEDFRWNKDGEYVKYWDDDAASWQAG